MPRIIPYADFYTFILWNKTSFNGSMVLTMGKNSIPPMTPREKKLALEIMLFDGYP
jgi:hypothetical protein